jgi:peptide/nickel transport system permease protein
MTEVGPTARLRIAAREWRRVNKSALLAIVFLVVLISAAAFANYLFPGDPELADVSKDRLPPSLAHPFGTDYLGRDQVVLIAYGARASLIVAFMAGTILAMLGTLTGLLAGYFGGRIDGLIMRTADVFLTIPTLPLILVVVSLAGPSLVNVMLIIGLTNWPSMTRIVRADALSLMKREFIEIEKIIGASPQRIIFRHLLPNQLSTILVYTSLSIPVVILTEAALEFLGLAPLSISWGFMLNTSMYFWITGAWWLTFFPGLAIFSTSLAFYLVSEGLKELLTPQLRRKRESLGVQFAARKK